MNHSSPEEKQELFDVDHPTTRQVVLFTVLLSFVVSILGTSLTLGIIGPFFNKDSGLASTVLFNRPAAVEKVTEIVHQKEVSERVLHAEEAVVSVADRFAASVVRIEGDGVDQDGKGKREARVGVAIAPGGFVLTTVGTGSDRFIGDAGEAIAVEELARNENLHIVALRTPEALGVTPVAITAAAPLGVGQSVVAIGRNPEDGGHAVSLGIVSSIVASDGVASPEYIETDAGRGGAYIGAPLVNLQGEIVGLIADAGAAGGSVRVVPIARLLQLFKDAQAMAAVRSARFFGVGYETITTAVADARGLGRDDGALIVGQAGRPAVLSESPAAAASLREGDIVLAVGGVRLNRERTLERALGAQEERADVALLIFRDGAEINLGVHLGKRP